LLVWLGGMYDLQARLSDSAGTLSGNLFGVAKLDIMLLLASLALACHRGRRLLTRLSLANMITRRKPQNLSRMLVFQQVGHHS